MKIKTCPDCDFENDVNSNTCTQCGWDISKISPRNSKSKKSVGKKTIEKNAIELEDTKANSILREQNLCTCTVKPPPGEICHRCKGVAEATGKNEPNQDDLPLDSASNGNKFVTTSSQMEPPPINQDFPKIKFEKVDGSVKSDNEETKSSTQTDGDTTASKKQRNIASIIIKLESGEKFAIDQNTMIGRAIFELQEKLLMALQSVPTISRKHMSINSTDEGFSIWDLASRNGTYVDGIRLANGEIRSVKDENLPVEIGLGRNFRFSLFKEFS